MDKNNSIVATYSSHTSAEVAVKELQQSGFDMKKLSIAGRDYYTDEHVVGYYNTGKFVLIVHGSMDETTHAKEILDRTSPVTLDHHQ